MFKKNIIFKTNFERNMTEYAQRLNLDHYQEIVDGCIFRESRIEWHLFLFPPTIFTLHSILIKGKGTMLQGNVVVGESKKDP